MNITALCVTSNSVYKLLGLDCYDKYRDCRTFYGKNPVICHPPCRGWTRFGKAMNAKPLPGEKDLAYFCLERVIINGGLLEHPFESDFAKHAIKLPSLQHIIIYQEWFGYFCPKKTILLMPKDYSIPELPFNLIPRVSTYRRKKDWANNIRHDTCHNLAKWLINLVQINEI